MRHLVPTFILITILLGYLTMRYSVEVGHIILSLFPSVTYLIGFVHESIVGSAQFNHRVLHIAYDSSYILLLIGLIILLRSMVRGNFCIYIPLTTLLAAFPLTQLVCCC